MLNSYINIFSSGQQSDDSARMASGGLLEIGLNFNLVISFDLFL